MTRWLEERIRLRLFERRIARLKKQGDRVGAARLCEEAEWYSEALELYLDAAEYNLAGRLYEELKEFELAGEMYFEGAEWTRASKMYVAAGQPAKAARVLESRGDGSDAAKLYLEAGELAQAADLYQSLGSFAQAAQCFEKLGLPLHAAENYAQHLAETTAANGGESSASDRDLALRAGALYEKAGAVDRASTIYQRAGLRLQAAELAARTGNFVQAGELFLGEKQGERAAEMFDLAGEIQRAALIRGEMTFRQSDAGAAAKWFKEGGDARRAAELYTSARELSLAGECYEELREFEAAADKYLEGEDRERASKMYAAAGQPVRAAEVLESSGHKSDAAGLYVEAGKFERAGELYQSLGEFLQAAACFEKMNRPLRAAQSYEAHWAATPAADGGDSSSSERDVVLKAGALYETAGAAKPAAELYRRAGLGLQGAELAARTGNFAAAGELFLEEEELARAAEMFDQAGESQRACSTRGEMALHEGDTATAAVWFEKAGDKGKASELYETAGCYFEAAMLAKELKDSERAMRLLERVDASHEKHEAAVGALCELFSASKDPSVVVEKLKTLLRDRDIRPETLRHYYTLGVAHESLGERESAARIFRQILNKHPGYECVEERLAQVTPKARPAVTTPFAPPRSNKGMPPPRVLLRHPSPYELSGKLGSGRTGRMFRGIDKRSRLPVAIKLLRPELLEDQTVARAFMQDAKRARPLKHPHLAKLLAVAEVRGHQAMVTEFVEGVSLASFLEHNERLSIQQVMYLLTNAAEALAYAHAHRLVHRNLKDAKIILGAGGDMRLTGLGLGALRLPQLGAEDGYPAPELLTGELPDPRSDVFSLGAMAIHCLNGAATERADGLGAPVQQILDRCVEPNPDDRFSSVAELLQALESVSSGLKLSAS